MAAVWMLPTGEDCSTGLFGRQLRMAGNSADQNSREQNENQVLSPNLPDSTEQLHSPYLP
jgi:hypothetical protein